MAEANRIYGTQEQWQHLRDWLEKFKPEALPYMYPVFVRGDARGIRAIANFPVEIDKWLLEACDLDWLLAKIREQHGEDWD